MRVGSGQFVYEVVEPWGQFPGGVMPTDVPGVEVDSQDRVFVLCRGENQVVVFDREGRFLNSWGRGVFKRPHALFIGSDDSVYVVVDDGHAVRKFTADGKLLHTIQTAPEYTGYVVYYPFSVARSRPPFCYPTACAESPQGDLYVTDGYGNARVHKFSRDGKLLSSWGDPGNGPGQFRIPHGILIDKTSLYVADRENERIQVFDLQGKFLSEWRDIPRPCDMCMDDKGNMYVAELGLVQTSDSSQERINPNAPHGQVTVRDRNGKVLAEWGGRDPQGDDLLFCPHTIAMDSHGDLYMGEVKTAYGGGKRPAHCPPLHKYVRV